MIGYNSGTFVTATITAQPTTNYLSYIIVVIIAIVIIAAVIVVVMRRKKQPYSPLFPDYGNSGKMP